jgi:PAS domain S-box-containing protein
MAFKYDQGLSILDNLADGLLVQTVPTGDIVHVNGGFLNLLVCDRSLLVRHPHHWMHQIYTEDRDLIRHWWHQLLVKPIHAERTYRILQPNGQFRWIQCRSLPITSPPGHPGGLATLHIDVTSQHHPSKDKSSEVSYLNSLFDQFLIGISGCAADGRILWTNEAFHPLLDYVPGELVDSYLQDLIAPSSYCCLASNWETLLTQAWSKELELLSGLHQSRWMLTTVAPLPSPLQATTFICMIQDITQYKKTEVELRTSLQDTAVLIAEIHHRVKNNLQIISSLLELQANRTGNVNAKTTLLSSQDRVLAMALIHETLYQSNNIAHINFGAYVQQLVAELTRAYMAEQTICLNLNLTATATISTDLAVPLGLILNELVANALKHNLAHTSQGSLTIDLQPLSHQTFQLSICQSPGGLPPDFSLEKSASMGLQIVKLLTHKIGATLRIQHSPVIFTVIFSANL